MSLTKVVFQEASVSSLAQYIVPVVKAFVVLYFAAVILKMYNDMVGFRRTYWVLREAWNEIGVLLRGEKIDEDN